MKKNKKLKKIKSFIDYVLGNKKGLLGYEYNPKFSRKLRAYSFESKEPIGNGKYTDNLMQITEWDNGEGYDFSVIINSKEKMYSMHLDEINLLLKALNKMKYFDYDKEELKE